MTKPMKSSKKSKTKAKQSSKKLKLAKLGTNPANKKPTFEKARKKYFGIK